MGGMKDYNKGFQSGYTTGPSRLPRTFAESVGYNAGRAQRERERTRNGSIAEGAEAGAAGGGLPVIALLIVGGLLLLGMLLVIPGSPVLKLFYPAAAVVGLVLTPRVRRVLRVGTPVYIGALLGVLVGCIDLALSSPELNLFNLMSFIFVGGMVGALAIPFALLRKK